MSHITVTLDHLVWDYSRKRSRVPGVVKMSSKQFFACFSAKLRYTHPQTLLHMNIRTNPRVLICVTHGHLAVPSRKSNLFLKTNKLGEIHFEIKVTQLSQMGSKNGFCVQNKPCMQKIRSRVRTWKNFHFGSKLRRNCQISNFVGKELNR